MGNEVLLFILHENKRPVGMGWMPSQVYTVLLLFCREIDGFELDRFVS